jgi:hypothetical protein
MTGHAQPLQPPDAMHAFDIYRRQLAADEGMGAPVAVTRVLARDDP